MDKPKNRSRKKSDTIRTAESDKVKKSLEIAVAVAREILSKAGLSSAQIAQCEKGADLRLKLPAAGWVKVDDRPERQLGSQKPYLANDCLRAFHSLRRAIANNDIHEAHESAFTAGVFAGALFTSETLPNAALAASASAEKKREKRARTLDPKILEIWNSVPKIDRNPAGIVFHLKTKFELKRSERQMRDDLKRLDLGN